MGKNIHDVISNLTYKFQNSNMLSTSLFDCFLFNFGGGNAIHENIYMDDHFILLCFLYKEMLMAKFNEYRIAV